MRLHRSQEMTPETTCERRVCADCGEVFTVTRREVQWYLSRGLEIPRRCAPCRKLRFADMKGK